MTDAIEEREFTARSDGLAIRGARFFSPGGPRPLLIVMHGIPRAKPEPGDRTYRDLGRAAAADGWLAAIFNFRGTGASEGDLSLSGWLRDYQAVAGLARTWPEADPTRIFLLGFSAGGSVAIRAAALDPTVNAVAAVSSPAEYSFLTEVMPAAGWAGLFREIGLIRDPGFPASLADWETEFDEAAPIKYVAGVAPRPLLIMHGTDDETIPVEHARLLYERAGAGRELVLIPGGKHRLRADERAVKAAREWLRKQALMPCGGNRNE